MASIIPDEALIDTFVSSNPNGLAASNGLYVNTVMPDGNLVIDSTSNAIYRSLRRNIAVPLTGLSPEAGQFQYSLTFGSTLLVDGGETVDVLDAAHALSPAWAAKLECPVPALPAGALINVKGFARLQMRAPTAAENGGASTAADGVGGRLALSFDGSATPVLQEFAKVAFIEGLISVDQPIFGEAWLDPSTVSSGKVRLHVLADGLSTSAAMRFTGISQVWLQVEW